jgi:hypothetical protein
LLLRALPRAAAVHVVPRLPGRSGALNPAERTRTQRPMTPGDVSDLSVSGEVAFRARFTSALPRPEDRYWRGPVLHEFDGRSWRRPQAQAFLAQEVRFTGNPVEYEVTLSPHGRRWILALDLPSQWPQREAVQAYDFTLLSPRSINTVGVQARVAPNARSRPDAAAVDAEQGSLTAGRWFEPARRGAGS